MAKSTSRQLIIDASIARAAGPENATHPTSQICRDFLLAVRDICHRMVFTDPIRKEWNDHQSGFARRWRVSMHARRKIDHLEAHGDAVLREQIEGMATPANAQIVLKDIHLVEAWDASHAHIVSLDDSARLLFAALSSDIRKLRTVTWVNPVTEHLAVSSWLESGAPDNPAIQLCGQKSDT